MTQVPLTYSPWTGDPLPSKPERFAGHYANPTVFWNYNPWTGIRRPQSEIQADPQGLKMEPPSHDPGTTSPPTPATTEAGTGTQEPGATDREPASTPNPNPTPAPTPCAAPSAMNAVLSSLGAAVAEVNALTRTAVELATKCRALQEENDRLQGRNDELVNRCRELDRLVDAAVKIRTPAEEAPAPDLVAAKCRALQEENDELVNRCRELLEALKASAHGLHPADDNGPCLCSQCQFVQLRDAAIAKATQQPHMRAAAGEGGEEVNTKGIQPKTFLAVPHPYLHGAWAVAGKDSEGRTLYVRDVAGGTCHWHTRGQAADAVWRLNGRQAPICARLRAKGGEK